MYVAFILVNQTVTGSCKKSFTPKITDYTRVTVHHKHSVYVYTERVKHQGKRSLFYCAMQHRPHFRRRPLLIIPGIKLTWLENQVGNVCRINYFNWSLTACSFLMPMNWIPASWNASASSTIGMPTIPNTNFTPWVLSDWAITAQPSTIISGSQLSTRSTARFHDLWRDPPPRPSY